MVIDCCCFPSRSMERSLTDEEINDLQERVRNTMVEKLGAELR